MHDMQDYKLKMFCCYNALLLPAWCHTLLISSAGCIYGKIPSGTEKVDHSSSSGWLMLFTEKTKSLCHVEVCVDFFFLTLFTPWKLLWVFQVLDSPTSIKRMVGRLGGVGCVGSRMKHRSPVVDVDRELKQQMWFLLSCLEVFCSTQVYWVGMHFPS